jgi:signal transduction histidine kinase
MRHAIRTPLTDTIGLAEVLLQHKISLAESAKFLTIINDGHHLPTLLSDILDISKIENQKLELESIHFNLPSLRRLNKFTFLMAKKSNLILRW